MSALTDRTTTEARLSLERVPEAPWVVLGASCREALARPFSAEVLLQLFDDALEVRDLLSSSCVLTLGRRGEEQRVCGLVTAARIERPDGHSARATLTVRPALALLEHRQDSRIFQDLSVPEILLRVLADDLRPYGREARHELRGDYLPREYTVQYRETDHDFVHRLMEEAGIGYWLDHDGPTEVMVLTDDNAQLPSLSNADDGALPYRDAGAAYAETGEDAILHFAPVTSMLGSRVSGRTFDWTRPSVVLEAAAGEPDALPDVEWYDHELPITFASFVPRRGYGRQDADGWMRRLRELQARDRLVVEAETNALGARAGRHLRLHGHPCPELDDRYLIVESEHRVGTHVSDGAGPMTHVCNITCIPSATPWRPDRMRDRPRIASVQTATVVGPAGEEIHTDEHGRVKVHFHWDRLSRRDEHSSCWIRVLQSMGGPGWGFSFIPRIGMEVVVTFVQGDPDKPLVTGVLYNAESPPPYDPSVDDTRTTIKTDSSPGHGGYHELRFEDRKGEEEIYLRSQKDWNIVIENDSQRDVRRDETEVVGRDRHKTVGHDEQVLVAGDRRKTVGKDQTEVVGQDRQRAVGMNEAVSVGANQKVTIGDRQDVTIDGASSTQIAGSSQETVLGETKQHVQKSQSTTVGANQTTQVGKSSQTNVVKNVTQTTGQNKSTVTGGNHALKTSGTRIESTGGSLTQTSGPATKSAGIGRITQVGFNDTLTVMMNRSVTIGGADVLTVGSQFFQSTTGDHSETIGGSYSTTAHHNEMHAVKGALRVLVADTVEITIVDNELTFTVAKGKLEIDSGASVTIDGAAGVLLRSMGDVKLDGARVSLADPSFSKVGACRGDALKPGVAINPAPGAVTFAGVPAALLLDAAIVQPESKPVPGHVAMTSSKVFVGDLGVARHDDMCLLGGAPGLAGTGPVFLSPSLSQVEKDTHGEGSPSGVAAIDDRKEVAYEASTELPGDGELKVELGSAELHGGGANEIGGGFKLRGASATLTAPEGSSVTAHLGGAELQSRASAGWDPATATSYFSARAAAGFEVAGLAASIPITFTPFDNATTDFLFDDANPLVRQFKNLGFKLEPTLGAKLGAGASAGVEARNDTRRQQVSATLSGQLGVILKGLASVEVTAGQVGTAGLVSIVAVRPVFVG